MIIQAEQFKASIAPPKGKPSVNDLDSVEKIANYLKSIADDDGDEDFFHVSCHIDTNLRQKIERGDFVELKKLLPKNRIQTVGEEKRLHLVQRDGETFITTTDRDPKIAL